MRTLAVIIVAVGALLQCGCVDVDAPRYESEPVIEAWIDSDGYPTVLFTASFSDNDQTAIADKMIRWGVVTISDGEQTVVLTGGPDRRFFPPYCYGTYEMQGKPGRTYTIDASFGDFHATATSTMPLAPVVAELAATPSERNDTLRDVKVTIVGPEDEAAYYHISTRVLPEESAFVPAVMGCAETTPGNNRVEVTVFRGKRTLDKGDFNSGIPRFRDVMIKVERVERVIYDFWMDYNENVLLGNNIFVNSVEPLVGNIEGGYGYFSAQGAVVLMLAAEAAD